MVHLGVQAQASPTPCRLQLHKSSAGTTNTILEQPAIYPQISSWETSYGLAHCLHFVQSTKKGDSESHIDVGPPTVMLRAVWSQSGVA